METDVFLDEYSKKMLPSTMLKYQNENYVCCFFAGGFC